MKKVLLLLLLFAGCAYPKRTSQYITETPLSGKAFVYIYRTPTFVDSLNPELPKFFLNGNLVGKLAIGGYYLQVVEPGETEVSYKDSFMGFYLWTPRKIKFIAQANQKYFIKYGIEDAMKFVIFKQVPLNIGEEEIKTTALLTN